MPPRIGLTTSFADNTQHLDRRYVAAVEAAGAAPVLLPTTDAPTTVDTVLDQIDGLVVPGGPAVTEGLTGPLPDDLDSLDEFRADSDRRWIEACWHTGRPILGICYGMQRLNALAGGTLYGDVEAEYDDADTHSQKRGATTHKISFVKDTRLHQWLGLESLTVNSRHLQALATLGDGFSVAARAPDGVIEAIEHETGRFFGVQFHPERMGDDAAPLFQALVEQARAVSLSPA